jgi:hypothetical protein
VSEKDATFFIFIVFNKMRLFLPFLFLLFVSTGCDAPVNDPAPNSTLKTTYLNVEVSHLYDDSLQTDSIVTLATIFLYDEEQDRTDSVNAIKESTVDSTGKARIDFVNYEYGDNAMFIKAAHPTLGIKLYELDLPPGSETTLKVIY